MDPISYGVAAKQKQRIEKVIAEPDSTSGVITVPQVIATGETITVPAGRVAVLPNVQVDGELVVDGEVFIPSGAGLSTVVQKSGGTMTGNLNFASGAKITGDFSGASLNNYTYFQTSTANANTFIGTIPNGTSTASGLICFSQASDLDNAARFAFYQTNTAGIIAQAKSGTGTYLPITFFTGGAERVRIDTAGNVGIGTTIAYNKLEVNGSIGFGSTTGNGRIFSDPNWGCLLQSDVNSPAVAEFGFLNNAGSALAVIDTSGNLLLRSGTGSIGYGTGSGGTVTQLTSKSTSVTLNKPCGQIIMNNSALASNTAVKFALVNSTISSDDLIVVNIVGGVTGFENYNIWGATYGGAATITVKNIIASSLSEAIVIKFSITKGAIA